MADHVIIASPFGTLALTPAQVAQASATARDLVEALDIAPQGVSAPPIGPEPTHWLSVDEVAQATGLKPSWLYQEIRANRLPSRQFGRQVRIPSTYLQAPDTKTGSKQSGGQ